MARTAASISAEIASLDAAMANRDQAVVSYRTPDGSQLTFDWAAARERRDALEARLDALQSTTATRRTQAVPTSDRW